MPGTKQCKCIFGCFFSRSIWEMSNNVVFIEQDRRHPGRRSSNKAFGCNLLRSCQVCNFEHFCELCMEISSVNAFFVVSLAAYGK